MADSFVWLCVARFEPVKGHPDLLKAFERVAAATDRTKLWLVGDGPLRGLLEGEVARAGLGEKVVFWGRRWDVESLMCGSDGFVMASHLEGLSLALIEGAAMELPIVTTAVGGNAEVVEDGVSGFVVPDGQPDSLAEKMLQIDSMGPETRKRLGVAGRRRAIGRYSMESVLGTWEGLYEELYRANCDEREEVLAEGQ